MGKLVITAILTCVFSVCCVLKYYNNIRKCITDIVSCLAATFGWFKSTSTKMSIETNATSSIETLNRIVPELDLPELSIEWIKTDNHGNVRLKPGKAIVLLKYDKDNTQNIINTTSAYIHKTLLINTKHFLDQGIKNAIDFAVIREFLKKTPQKNFIVTQYINTCTNEIDQYSDAFEKVIKVEDEGLFTRLLLREYAIWGNKLIGKIRSEELVNESKEFLDYIFNIASREFDELTPLVFNNKNLKVAILLVAKYDTYAEKGIEPYVRRIREGFANGINTFYLLARNDKIDILNNVYGEIISSGNYNLLNGPEIYKDNLGRDNICYCIEVKRDADLAQSYEQIQRCIEEEISIEVTIVSVYRESLSCNFNGVSISIERQEITEDKELRLKSYYYIGMTIEVIPLRVGEGGVVYASVRKTLSNPKELFDNEFKVGSFVNAIVESADDDFITLRVKDSSQKCVAYRRNLTNSRFELLHKLFPIGFEFHFIISNINYLRNQLELKVPTLSDPWKELSYCVGDKVEFDIYNIKETCFETELKSSIYAILPYSELSWFEEDIEKIKHRIKRNTKLSGYIKRIDYNQKLVIISYKDINSPYLEFYNTLSQNKEVIVRLESQNAYGILGRINSKYRVFIPLSETAIGVNTFKYKIGNEYKIKIKSVDKYANSLIGTFKPFIEHPLQFVVNQFYEGQILSKLPFSKSFDRGLYFTLKGSEGKKVEVLLLNSEVTDNCFVNDLKNLFNDSYTCPMILKKIDLDRNIVLLSIKELTNLNNERIQTLKYGEIYHGRVLGKKSSIYYVLLDNIWAEIPVESESYYKTGDCINIVKVSSNQFMDEKDVPC